MHIIACLDDRGGMSFGGRRQSMDRAVRRDILDILQGKSLRMLPYSAQQFTQGNILAEEDFLDRAQPGDSCFVENVDITPYLKNVSQITLYRWNRQYPADLYFPALKDWKCVQRLEFSGYSHETITREVYVPWQKEAKE